MDVSGISTFASSVSAQKSFEANSSAQVTLIKKQSDQDAKVVGTILESAETTPAPDGAGKGNLLGVA